MSEHLPFIVASYLAGVAIVGGLGLMVWLRLRKAERTLAQLETARTATRRRRETEQER